jgi:phosphate starvation-inducible protein PhoH
MEDAKVMIVEDNTTVAEDLRHCLEKLGYGVTSVVASGEESNPFKRVWNSNIEDCIRFNPESKEISATGFCPTTP